jgi:hypothetical protein
MMTVVAIANFFLCRSKRFTFLEVDDRFMIEMQSMVKEMKNAGDKKRSRWSSMKRSL